jgi:hypothetical protein
MDDLDRRLTDAGERWREGLGPRRQEIDPSILTQRGGSSWLGLGGLSLTVVASALVVAVVIVARPNTNGTAGSATCQVTVPTEAFVPPDPFPSVPTSEGTARWYGTPHLWTMLQADGDTWTRAVVAPHAFNEKLFWWSTDWSPSAEPQPAITVTAERLDGSGTATGTDPTNATAEFGTAMLVGLELPDAGCWRISATYRGTTLSYVVRAADD